MIVSSELQNNSFYVTVNKLNINFRKETSNTESNHTDG